MAVQSQDQGENVLPRIVFFRNSYTKTASEGQSFQRKKGRSVSRKCSINSDLSVVNATISRGWYLEIGGLGGFGAPGLMNSVVQEPQSIPGL